MKVYLLLYLALSYSSDLEIIHNNDKISALLYSIKNNKDSIVIIVHGYSSDKSAGNRLPSLVKIFNSIGMSVLSYDARGHGGSSDVIVTFDTMKDDLITVYNWCINNGYKKVLIFAASMGCYTAAKAVHFLDHKNILGIICLGAVSAPVADDDEDLGLNAIQRESKKKLGYYIEDRWPQKNRPNMIISGNFWDEITNFSVKDIWNFRINTLFIHGTKDGLEKRFLDATLKNEHHLPINHKLSIITEADHSFLTVVDELEAIIKNWMLKLF